MLNLPQTTNVEVKIPWVWLPEVKKVRRETYLYDKFWQDDLSPTQGAAEGWQGAWPMDQGGHSKTALWVQASANGWIEDRILRKDVRKHASEWADMTQWDYPFEKPRNSWTIKPAEVTCQQETSGVRSSRLGQRVEVPEVAASIPLPSLPSSSMQDVRHGRQALPDARC